VPARDQPLVRGHLWVALTALAASVAIAVALAADYHAGWLADHAAWALAHAILAAYGFMGFLVLGLSRILVPMFATSEAPEAVRDHAALWLAAAGLAIGAVGIVIELPALVAAAAALGLLAALLHVCSMLSILRRRLRRRLGDEFWLIGLSWVMLTLSLLLAALLALDLLPASGGTLFVFVLLFGWLSSMLAGVLQRILPFLASMHVARAGGRPISPNRLVMRAPLLFHRCGHGVAIAAVASGILFDVPRLIGIGGAAGVASGLALAVFALAVQLRTRRHLTATPTARPRRTTS